MVETICYRNFKIVTPDSRQLAARAYHPRESRGAVVVARGMGSVLNPTPFELTYTPNDAEEVIAMKLARRGFYALTYTHRGHGKSSGSLNIRASIKDLEHVSSQVARRYGSPFVVGYSMGGYDALHVASRNPGFYKAITAIAAPHSMKEVLPESVRSLMRKTIRMKHHDAIARAVIAGINMFVFNSGHRLEYLKSLVTDREVRSRLFTYVGACRLPERLARSYIDLIASPDISDADPIDDPVLFMCPENETFVHRKGEREKYLSVFRGKIKNMKEEEIPNTGHACDRGGVSVFETDDYLIDLIEEHFESNASKIELTR